ncbi:DUF2066 domain-containing protein [Coralloluteibacterium stylophorae]|uniref:DUF2066 domain-containing protein n=1 Tax=Coralloluteibacterium stylophorae TaxID=1776034 RepID=A0A8J7VWC7_9GAMM|nr:DUF2066 domain-containing protein [Coralloluteibacterium stylophorae]MBS7456729.1 DUF2066 domain-containing protein [Coralloluteibacterium stylophorae]
MPQSALRSLMFLCLWALAVAAHAQGLNDGMGGLYSGEVPVNGQGSGEREAGMRAALAQVVVKLTGDEGAPRHPLVARQLRSADTLATGYSYRQDTERGPGGAPVYRQTLVVEFDRAAIDALVAAAGLPLWPVPRPPVALLLAIDDGRGARLVNAQQTSVVRSLTERAQARGLELRLPAAGAGDVDAVWALDPAAARGREQALLGKLYRQGGGWAADWSLVIDGVEAERWSSGDGDARRAMAGGADPAATALAARFAEVVELGPPEIVSVGIEGVRSSEDYLRLMGYLQGLAVVRGVVPETDGRGALRLQLDLASGYGAFEQLVGSGDVLAPVPGAAGLPVLLLRP